MKRILSILMFSMLCLLTCSAKSNTEISGTVDGGLRVIDIESKSKIDFRVYRGDYILFDLKDLNSSSISIPELDIESVLPIPEGETPYFKMKDSGTYTISIGDKDGTISVIDYTGTTSYKEVSATEAKELIDNISPFILDVRTRSEYSSGYIDGAGVIPVQQLADSMDRLESFKNEPMLIYCQSGNRSTVASKMFIDAGFTHVYNLRSGIAGWKREGYPVVK